MGLTAIGRAETATSLGELEQSTGAVAYRDLTAESVAICEEFRRGWTRLPIVKSFPTLHGSQMNERGHRRGVGLLTPGTPARPLIPSRETKPRCDGCG